MLLRYCSLNDGVPGTQIRIICGLNGKQSSLMCWENLLLFFAIRNNIKYRYILLQLSMETSADPKPNPSPNPFPTVSLELRRPPSIPRVLMQVEIEVMKFSNLLPCASPFLSSTLEHVFYGPGVTMHSTVCDTYQPMYVRCNVQTDFLNDLFTH